MLKKRELAPKAASSPLIFTVLWVIFGFALALFDACWAQRPTKLNEWGDYLAGFSSIPLLYWVIANYRQKELELKEQKENRKNQIRPKLKLALNNLARDSNNSYIQLNFKLENSGGYCDCVNILVNNSSQLTLPKLPKCDALHRGATLTFSTNPPINALCPHVKITYLDIDGQEYGDDFESADLLSSNYQPPCNVVFDRIKPKAFAVSDHDMDKTSSP